MASKVRTSVNVGGTVVRVSFTSHASSLLSQRSHIKAEYKRAHGIELTEEQADKAFTNASIW